LSQHFPVCSANDVIEFCAGRDFYWFAKKAVTKKWRHANGRQVIVAMHGSKPIPIGTLKSIIEGSGIAVDHFR
jgi:predicted RNA binding protein YcfA (HicA-like mRNA interferase family)